MEKGGRGIEDGWRRSEGGVEEEWKGRNLRRSGKRGIGEGEVRRTLHRHDAFEQFFIFQLMLFLRFESLQPLAGGD